MQKSLLNLERDALDRKRLALAKVQAGANDSQGSLPGGNPGCLAEF